MKLSHLNEIELTLKKKVIVNGKSIVIPKNMDDFPLQFSIIDGNHNCG